MDILKYSVALCTYNGEKYIAEQLRSILQQTFKPSQIIVSDDGSSDKTILIAETVLSKSNIDYRIVKNTTGKGVISNFQNAISLCRENLIFTSDQDDVWMSNKAYEMIKCFEINPTALLIFSDGELVDENLELLNCSMWKSVGISSDMLKENDWFDYMLNRCFVTGAAMAFKRNLFSKNENIPQAWLHDGWLAWKAVSQGGLIPCDKRLILYRQHKNNVVGMNNVTSLKRIKKYLRNFKIMKREHIIRYERYKVLQDSMGHLFSEEENNHLTMCIDFWNDLVKADKESSKIRRMKLIINNWRKNNFLRFSNGNKGAIREVLIALFD